MSVENVDGQGVLHDTSDVYYDRPCESCIEDGRNVEAISFCPVCDTFLCQECLNVHSRLRSSRGHPILRGDDMPKCIEDKPVRYPHCANHVSGVKDLYCLKHETMICENCCAAMHESCKVISVTDACKNFDLAALHRAAEATSKTLEGINKVKESMETELQGMAESRARMLGELKEMYTQVTDFILGLYKETQRKLEETCDEHKLEIAVQLSALSDYKRKFETFALDLKTLEVNKFNERNFIRFQDLKVNMQDAGTDLCSANSEFENREFQFKINEELQAFLTSFSVFGNVIVEKQKANIHIENIGKMISEENKPSLESVQQKSTPEEFAVASAPIEETIATCEDETQEKFELSEIKVVETKQLNVSIKEDNLVCFITGIAVRRNGDILVVDWNNNKVKLFSSEGKLLSFLELSSLKLAYWPCDICLIDDNTVVVCLTGTNRLHLLKLKDNSMKLEKTLKLSKAVWSVTPYDLELVITCGTNHNIIQVLKLDGSVDWSIETDKNSQHLFENINDIVTVGKYSRKVVVIEKENVSVSLLHVDRVEILQTCTIKDKLPKKVTADQDGNVFVCYDSKEIIVWSEDLPKSICLVNDLKHEPAAMTYSQKSNELLVSYESCDIVDRFILKGDSIND